MVFFFVAVSCLELSSTEFHGALIVSPAVSPQSISWGLQASGKDSPNGVLQVSSLSSLPSEHLPADPVDLGAQPQRCWFLFLIMVIIFLNFNLRINVP